MVSVGTLIDSVRSWAGTTSGSIVFAILSIVVAYVIGRIVVRVLGRRVARRFERPSIRRAVLRGVRLSIIGFGFFVALGFLGLQIGDIALSVTVFSAVLGLILAPIVGSVVSGLFVLADQPYEVGDMVKVVDTGQTGFVEDITLRYTKLFTMDNTFLVVPNSEIRNRDVMNYSAEDRRTRLALDILVTYEGDLGEARALIEEAAKEVDDVITGGPDIRIGSARYPAAPTCYIDQYGDHGVNLRLRYWVKRPYKLLTARSAVQERVWERLGQTEGVSIAYPHSHLVFDESSGRAQVDVLGPNEDRPAPHREGAGGDPGHDRDS